MADGAPTIPGQSTSDMPQKLTSDSVTVSSNQQIYRYGLFLDGVLALEPDSFIGYGFSNNSLVPQYPQENGAFQSYNKVDTPFNLRIRVAKGGSTTDVANFIDTAEALVKASNLNLYSVITPERTYNSVTIVKISHDHKPDSGANMVTMDIEFLEIRNSATAQYTNTASPTASGSLSNTASAASSDKKVTGTVQAATPTPTQAKAANTGLANLADAISGADTVVP